jgi:hypothetical protein
MTMKARRNTATPTEVTPAPLCGNIVPRYRRILTAEWTPVKSLKIKGKKGNLRISY